MIVSAADPVTANAADEADPVTAAVDPVTAASRKNRTSPWSHRSGMEAWVLAVEAMTATAMMEATSPAPTEMGTTCTILTTCR